MNINLSQLTNAIEPIIQKAGEILLSHFNTVLDLHTKPDGSIATNADIASETYLKKELAALLPEASFNAEESGKQGSSSYCFVIDPLDGTTNFSRGIGYFCISICLTYNEEPILGITYQPLMKELFVARKGEGAFLNGQKLNISTPVALDQSLTVVGLPYTKNKQYAELLEMTRVIAPKSLAFRHLGACALDLAYVAAGRMNGVYFADLAWWDVAAGSLLIQEAGGTISDFEGNPITPAFKTCVAGSPLVYGVLKSLVKQARE